MKNGGRAAPIIEGVDLDAEIKLRNKLPKSIQLYLNEYAAEPRGIAQVYDFFKQYGEALTLRALVHQQRGETLKLFGPTHPEVNRDG